MSDSPSLGTRPQLVESTAAVGETMADSVRALSHDLAANFMLLESSLRSLRATCDADGLSEPFVHVDACLRESRRYLDDLQFLGRSGHVPYEPRRLDLDQVLQEVLSEQAPLLVARKIRIRVASQLPAIWCNDARIKQVLTNLLRNAALHGCNPRRPWIRIRAEVHRAPSVDNGQPSGNVPSWVWLRIHDNGPGIPPEHRQTIFLPGKRLESRAAGTGTGLATVASVVAHYGGAVWVDAGAKGAAFILSIPRAPRVAADQATFSLPQPHMLLEGRGARIARRAKRGRNVG